MGNTAPSSLGPMTASPCMVPTVIAIQATPPVKCAGWFPDIKNGMARMVPLTLPKRAALPCLNGWSPKESAPPKPSPQHSMAPMSLLPSRLGATWRTTNTKVTSLRMSPMLGLLNIPALLLASFSPAGFLISTNTMRASASLLNSPKGLGPTSPPSMTTAPPSILTTSPGTTSATPRSLPVSPRSMKL